MEIAIRVYAGEWLLTSANKPDGQWTKYGHYGDPSTENETQTLFSQIFRFVPFSTA